MVSYLTFPTEGYDTDAFHDNSSNNTRITIPTGLGGYYQISGFVIAGAVNNPTIKYYLRKNGSVEVFQGGYIIDAGGGVYGGFSFCVVANLSAADYIELGIQPGATSASYSVQAAFQATLIGV